MLADRLYFVLFLIAFIPQLTFAGHPLRTDDGFTIGVNRLQLEFTPEVWNYGNESLTLLPMTGTYGIFEKLDLVVALCYCSYQGLNAESGNSGMNDIVIETKWNIYNYDKFNLAVKPGLILPIGNHTKGLGTGKLGYSLLLIADQEISSLLLHFNIGYMRNENRLLERTDLWLTSLAAEIPVAKSLSLVVEIGAFSNRDKIADGHPAFVLAGAIYSIADGLDIDIGLQKGLNKHETNLGILAGITVLF